MTIASQTRQGAPASMPRTERVTRGGRAGVLSLAGVALVLVGLATLPYVVQPGITTDLVTLFSLVTLASMWNLLAGYAGMVSVGQQAFIGLGAYTLFVVNDAGLDVYSGTVVAAVVVGLLAWPVSYLAFRLRGGYFAIGTWVIAEVARLVVIRFDSLGGGRGRRLATVTADPLLRKACTYWLALAVMGAAVLVGYGLLRSRVGLDLQATRDDEVGADSLGVPVTRTKRLVFVVAAAGCAAAGGVICVRGLGVSSPSEIFGVQYSAFMIFMVVIGGIGTVEGPVIGALAYYALERALGQSGVWYLVLLGVLAIVVTLFLPKGLWGTLQARTGWSVFPVTHRVRRAPDQPPPTPHPTTRESA